MVNESAFDPAGVLQSVWVKKGKPVRGFFVYRGSRAYSARSKVRHGVQILCNREGDVLRNERAGKFRVFAHGGDCARVATETGSLPDSTAATVSGVAFHR